nr:hypothetical protein 13 [bacterium]
MLISDIETSIKERLKAKIVDEFDQPEFEVESFPKNFREFIETFSHPKGVILVTFESSSFSAPEGLGAITQKETIDFTAVLLLRIIKSDEAHPYIEKIKNALKGYKIPGCAKIYPKKIDFLDENFGTWIYKLDFALSTIDAEIPEQTDEIKLKKITYQDEY